MTAYQTIASPATGTYTEKKSEFIAQLTPVATIQEAQDFIESVRKKHYKARHNVYAYQIRDPETSKYSDDGEPQGTAGLPIMDVLQKQNLTNICCVVTRYFGGVLLGANGLVRAYTHSIVAALEQAQILIMCPCYPVSIYMDYTQYGKILHNLSQDQLVIKNTIFTDQVEIQIYVKTEAWPTLQHNLIEWTGNQVQTKLGNIQYMDFPAQK